MLHTLQRVIFDSKRFDGGLGGRYKSAVVVAEVNPLHEMYVMRRLCIIELSDGRLVAVREDDCRPAFLRAANT